MLSLKWYWEMPFREGVNVVLFNPAQQITKIINRNTDTTQTPTQHNTTPRTFRGVSVRCTTLHKHQHNTAQYTQHNTTPRTSRRVSVRNTTLHKHQHNTAQYTQHNTHNTTQHNTTQHNTTQSVSQSVSQSVKQTSPLLLPTLTCQSEICK